MIKPAKIVSLRKKLGLSQAKTAQAINEELNHVDCYQNSICRWETGTDKIPGWYAYILKILVDRAIRNG